LTARSSSLDGRLLSIVEQIVECSSPGQGVAALRKQESQFATTSRLWELEVTLTDGTTLSVVHKESGRRARLPGAPRTVPAFVYDPKREIRVYEQLLENHRLSTPRLYACDVNPRAGRYWLFLERVPGMQLRWAVEPSAWHRAAAWLARAHTALRPNAKGDTAALVTHDPRYYRRWLRRAQIFTDRDDRDRRSRLAWVARHHHRAIEILAGLPPTVIHGEFYPSNILVDESTPDGRISVIDWEMAALGPAVIDLAALTGGGMTVADRESIVRSYVEAATTEPPDGGESVGGEALTCARLQFAIQWLGWSREWSAPEEQRHDWLAEAVELGHMLGW
jgi:aminoglycoside phosphotransferase (APT) family kinase protein